MSKFTKPLSAIAALTMLATSSSAFAQRLGGPSYQPGPGAYGETHRNEASNVVGATDKYGFPVKPGPGACIKLCPRDNLPCDPIQYKTADNRCGGGSRN